MNIRSKIAAFALILGCTLAASSRSYGSISITPDEILFQGAAGNAGILSGTVDMSVSGDLLTIVLTNTSSTAVLEGNGAGNLLTGVGFTLPLDYSISEGTATIVAGSQIGWSGTTNVSTEWGYNKLPINSGHFDGSPSVFAYRNVVGTVTSDIDTQFLDGSLGGSTGVGGPDFGLLSALVPTSVAGGQRAAQSPLTVVLTLNKAVADGDAFLASIDSNPVAISFGSPSTSNRIVPELSSCFVWAGLGICGYVVAFFRRGRRA